MSEKHYTIGALATQTELSVDTLRYYEKIGLLQDIPRQNGQRRYTRHHLEQLLFIRRAQAMDFSLAEIDQLIRLRRDPVGSRDEVRELAEEKLEAINQRIEALTKLQQELGGLVQQCKHGGPGACPIIKGLEQTGEDDDHRNCG